ncbi:MAG: carbohydrate kinase [Rhodobacter sp.]|nr:carbohydrate kinase [Rhodobacter sp.]MCA3460159.1 carbohydrate kinase [Rhodobacter sp.]MCA3463453.1 carbohydrate kinase [Rhodobacter sp.]MCA3466698.1 carbohydrate kinase [Rhodobacter sp.]MCA3469294.1 carbohydrate kinase [Rhodobacter sp.]
MAPDLLLGIDFGNTVVKAVLFDFAGRQVARRGVDGTTLKPAPGMVERPVAELWANARAAISGCLKGIDPARIAAIGLAGHGNGLYLLDKAGAPLLGIQSLDSRAAALAADLDASVGAELHAICGQRPWPSQTPALLAWVKAHQPKVYARAGTLCFAKDIIGWHLTGERATEVSDMSGAGLLRLPEVGYDAGLLSLYGLSDAMPMLPRLCQPTEVVGHVTPAAASATGLRAGIPVVAGYFDVVASALGSGAIGPGTASIVLGSWSINQVFADTPARDPDVFMIAAFGPGRFANMDNSATSAVNLEWYVRTLIERNGHKGDAFAQVNALVGRAAMAAADPMFHPFLYGGRHGAHQRGGFYGLAGWHDEGHLLRALYEGVAFEHRRHVEVLRKAGSGIGQVFLSGGGTRSPHWPQMMADVLGLPVRLGSAEETGALGGAIAAAVGTGLHGSEEAAVAAMTTQRAVLLPDPDRKSLHDRRFAVWQRMTTAMEPFWAELAELGRP